MLDTMEGTLKSSRGTVLTVEWTSSKKKSNEKKKVKSAKKQKKENKLMKEVPRKVEAKGKYFHCDAEGHWRRNCLLYLERLKTKKGDKLFKDMLVIESNLTVSFTSSWILDSDLSAHICTSMQDLIESRRLREGDMIFQIGNGVKITAKAIGTCWV